jgi:hypothetical protein
MMMPRRRATSYLNTKTYSTTTCTTTREEASTFRGACQGIRREVFSALGGIFRIPAAYHLDRPGNLLAETVGE